MPMPKLMPMRMMLLDLRDALEVGKDHRESHHKTTPALYNSTYLVTHTTVHHRN